MAVKEDVVTGQEAWRNYTRGKITLHRLDHRGELSKHEIVAAGRIVHISPEERRLNQEKYWSTEVDPFLNGFLVPVRLLPDDPDTQSLQANPNLLADEDMRRLVGGSAKALVARLADITNPITLERMLAIAIDEDVRIRVAEAIRTRVAEVRGTAALEAEAPPENEPGDEDRRRQRPSGIDPDRRRDRPGRRL